MLVRFLKAHLDWNINQEADINDDIANYLISMHVVSNKKIDNEAINAALDMQLQKVKRA